MKATLNFIALLLSLLTIAQEPNSNFQSTQLPTYSFDDPNPLPALAFNPKIYPYHKFEGYRVTPSPQTFKLVRLENDYITVEVLPEVGGKVWGAVDKSNGNEFIYKNEVIKFRDIAMRGPWTSGGIEFNFGIIGHHPGTATPVDYTVETLPDGTQVCVVGTIDLPSRTQWRVRIELEPNKGAFATQATWYNPTATEKAYYNWMTAAAAVTATEEQQHARWRSTYTEHETHVRHTRRARRDQSGIVGCSLALGVAYEHPQTIPVAFGVRDAVDVERGADGDPRTFHGDAVGIQVKVSEDYPRGAHLRAVPVLCNHVADEGWGQASHGRDGRGPS